MTESRLDAGTLVWVCEKGHVDDYHGSNPGDERCSRCGGATVEQSLDGLASEGQRLRSQLAEREAELERLRQKLIACFDYRPDLNEGRNPDGDYQGPADVAGVILDDLQAEVTALRLREAAVDPALVDVRDCPNCENGRGTYDGRVLIAGRGIYTCGACGERWQDADEQPTKKGIPLSEEGR